MDSYWWYLVCGYLHYLTSLSSHCSKSGDKYWGFRFILGNVVCKKSQKSFNSSNHIASFPYLVVIVPCVSHLLYKYMCRYFFLMKINVSAFHWRCFSSSIQKQYSLSVFLLTYSTVFLMTGLSTAMVLSTYFIFSLWMTLSLYRTWGFSSFLVYGCASNNQSKNHFWYLVIAIPSSFWCFCSVIVSFIIFSKSMCE